MPHDYDATYTCPCGYRGRLRSFLLADGGFVCPACRSARLRPDAEEGAPREAPRGRGPRTVHRR